MPRQTAGHLVQRYAVRVAVVLGYVVGIGLLVLVLTELLGWDLGPRIAE
jgi:hypothetical protein